jgi:hypothetical protein
MNGGGTQEKLVAHYCKAKERSSNGSKASQNVRSDILQLAARELKAKLTVRFQ